MDYRAIKSYTFARFSLKSCSFAILKKGEINGSPLLSSRNQSLNSTACGRSLFNYAAPAEVADSRAVLPV